VCRRQYSLFPFPSFRRSVDCIYELDIIYIPSRLVSAKPGNHGPSPHSVRVTSRQLRPPFSLSFAFAFTCPTTLLDHLRPDSTRAETASDRYRYCVVRHTEVHSIIAVSIITCTAVPQPLPRTLPSQECCPRGLLLVPFSNLRPDSLSMLHWGSLWAISLSTSLQYPKHVKCTAEFLYLCTA
jgi:hypothetical protein